MSNPLIPKFLITYLLVNYYLLWIFATLRPFTALTLATTTVYRSTHMCGMLFPCYDDFFFFNFLDSLAPLISCFAAFLEAFLAALLSFSNALSAFLAALER